MAFRSWLTSTLLCFTLQPATAWWGEGHEIITRAAVRTLPVDTLEFFQNGENIIARSVYDADLSKNRLLPNLRDREYPEHFLNIEWLGGRSLPATRSEFTKVCRDAGVDVVWVGFLPYALAEWTDKLTLALAEFRKWPQLEDIQNKALVYAGYVAHYAQDMYQPLHLTIHFDGWVQEPGEGRDKRLYAGIHERVDSLLGRLELDSDFIAKACRPVALDSLMPEILTRLKKNHRKVEIVYDFADELELPTKRVTNFGVEQATAAAEFTASLFLTAWHQSAKIHLPARLTR